MAIKIDKGTAITLVAVTYGLAILSAFVPAASPAGIAARISASTK